MKQYTLFVGENCHQCEDISNFLKINNISYREINVDLTDEKPPIQLFAFPALFKGQILLRYGSDIKKYFKNKS